jgi:DNA-binding NtrC family response regulator
MAVLAGEFMSDSKNLLVVDDVNDWRIILKGLLEGNGYNVDVASTMESALELLNQNVYNAALLDLRLDDSDEDNIDGLELAKIIKQRWPQIKTIIITGYGTSMVLKQAMDLNSEGVRLVADYIPKEDAEKIVETVRRVLI